MTHANVDDTRAKRTDERLLEDSWTTRSREVSRRELLVEASSSLLFLALAIPLALSASGRFNPGLAAALVALYALSGMVKFPIGAGYVVPSYMVLVPMLLLLPAGSVPLLAAGALVVGTLVQAAAKKAQPERAVLAVSDAWHTLGPVAVLLAAGVHHGALTMAGVYVAAFIAGCLVDLGSAVVRESAILGIGSRVQLRVIAVVWLIDACVAPLGLLVASATHQHEIAILLLIPFMTLLLLLSRDRTERIARAQQRLELIARERNRLQTAVRRMGEALAAKLDLDALTNIVLRGSVEALDADAGRLELHLQDRSSVLEVNPDGHMSCALDEAVRETRSSRGATHLERGGVWALALPFGFEGRAGEADGAVAVARVGRSFREDEQRVMHDLVERARQAASEIVLHQLLLEQALTDSLTKLGNRRKLEADLGEAFAEGAEPQPRVLILFDLDGFKSYNDTFGHPAGDAILARLGSKLAAAVGERGSAYRLGGDEFCVLATAESSMLHTVLSSAVGALEERGEGVAIGASYGAVVIPHEAATLDYALQLADERMYAHKKGRSSQAGSQARDVLMRIIHAKQPSLEDHSSEVAQLCLRVGRRFGMTAEELDELMRAAELHDIGKVGIPDAILDKPAGLDENEWRLMRQHTVLGERILSAAPALRPVAVLVRASHERWDGDGYPDGLAGEQIPLGARIISACDAYEAITSDRCYRAGSDHAAACAELRRCAGRQFDPQVVEFLLDELREMRRVGVPTHSELEREGRRKNTEEVAASLQAVLASGVRSRDGAGETALSAG
jgi:diguanylate cyclase (GGDEF)-like protein